MTGKVIFFSKHLGYGFIRVDGDAYPDAFLHFRHIEMEGFKMIKKGRKVQFDLRFTRLGPAAIKVVPI